MAKITKTQIKKKFSSPATCFCHMGQRKIEAVWIGGVLISAISNYDEEKKEFIYEQWFACRKDAELIAEGRGQNISQAKKWAEKYFAK